MKELTQQISIDELSISDVQRNNLGGGGHIWKTQLESVKVFVCSCSHLKKNPYK